HVPPILPGTPWHTGRVSRLSPPSLVALIAGAVLVTLLLIVHLTQADRGLRVEAVAQQTDAADAPGTGTTDAEPVFSLEEVRSSLLVEDSGGSPTTDPELAETLLYCDEGLGQAAALTIEAKPFPVVLPTEPGEDSVFAAAVIGEEGGQPRLHLVVSGQDLSL